MNDRARSTRRQFLNRTLAAGAAVAGIPAIIPGRALGADGAVAPSERIGVGVIGLGAQARYLMKNCLPFESARILAVCDVNRLRLEDAVGAVNDHYQDKGCAGYGDFRELLARDDIDAVIIGSCDHWHVHHGVYAARAGKDMYIEKPLSPSLEWCKSLREVVHRYDRVFQFGTQQRSTAQFRFACELAINKKLGELRKIQVGAPASRVSENIEATPMPDWIDYDLWQGPAPERPYSDKRIINEYWWHNSDYATGFVAGWGIHHVDIAQWGKGADRTGPVEVEGTGVFPRDGFCDCATKWNITMKYADGVILDYTDDGQNPHGIRFIGDEGWVHVTRSTLDAEPKSLLQATFGPSDIRLYESNHHIGNFLECVKSRRPTACDIDTTLRSETICHLSEIAMRLRRKLAWDPAAERFVNDDEANRMLERAMRAPWRL